MNKSLSVKLQDDPRSFEDFDVGARAAAAEALVEGMAKIVMQNPATRSELERFVMSHCGKMHDLGDKPLAHALFSLWCSIDMPSRH